MGNRPYKGLIRPYKAPYDVLVYYLVKPYKALLGSVVVAVAVAVAVGVAFAVAVAVAFAVAVAVAVADTL